MSLLKVENLSATWQLNFGFKELSPRFIILSGRIIISSFKLKINCQTRSNFQLLSKGMQKLSNLLQKKSCEKEIYVETQSI
jgi:hypothetical protein